MLEFIATICGLVAAFLIGCLLGNEIGKKSKLDELFTAWRKDND